MSTRRTRVYIAGPYAKPDPCENTHRAMDWWDILADRGYAPFCPHWTHFQHTFSPRPRETWLEFDNEWIPVCDAVFRLHGESSGADAEVELASKLGIPVVFSYEELCAKIPLRKEV